ncbi:protein MIZU-KUSSEI 1 [Carica papaya]|uniref:protein MIZU-KUSSEI 1 n=1 Tax=Carica papaya TaxID=3649 RepID=UPI000B8CBD58|nr:protein MIZU-KUSSEI 1 [Carica papaya]
MTKIDALRRFLLPCLSPTTTAPTTTIATKKRLSTSLRDDKIVSTTQDSHKPDQESQDSSSSSTTVATVDDVTSSAPPRQSKTMVIGTIFGHRKGHVWFCIQHDRLSTKPFLLLELSIPTYQLVREMRSGLVRIALECSGRPDLASCPLRSIPVWTMYCNGRMIGFALRRKPSEENRQMLKTMQSMTVGAGVIPSGFGSPGSEEVMYMRANYEHVVGSSDSESFHLINPDECPGQELSVFLLRSS